MTEPIELIPLLATRVKRFLAYLIDILPIIFLTMIVFYGFFGFDEVMNSYIQNPEDLNAREDFLDQRDWISRISFSVWIFYCAVMESSTYQATIGKLLLKMKVVDEFGNRLTAEKSAIRNLSKIISMIVFSLGFLWIIIDRRKQGWHDKIARTFVMDRELFDNAMKQGGSTSADDADR